MTFGHQLVCFCHHHYIHSWRVWDYSLVIKLHALSSWLIPTAAVGALGRFKALPRADAASHRKCLTAFFHQCLWNKDRMEKWFQWKRDQKKKCRCPVFDIKIRSEKWRMKNIPVFYVIVYCQGNTVRTNNNMEMISKIRSKQWDKIYFHMCIKKMYSWLL